MTTFFLEWNGDLVLTPNGSIQMAVNWDEVRERIIRRFLTNPAQQLPDGSYTPADYIFDPAYGIGAGALVDQNPTQAWLLDLNRRMRQAVLSDSAVDPGSVPQTVLTRPAVSTYQIFVSVKLVNGQAGQVLITIGAPLSSSLTTGTAGSSTALLTDDYGNPITDEFGNPLSLVDNPVTTTDAVTDDEMNPITDDSGNPIIP